MQKFKTIIQGFGTFVKYAGAVMIIIEGIEWTYNRFKEKFADLETDKKE
ncbi:hypothetical protein [Flavobacterium coralii]|tara:strand:+ start:223 stop:369 length:147 start_codon:yes stop_codon:yes gene_type:complete